MRRPAAFLVLAGMLSGWHATSAAGDDELRCGETPIRIGVPGSTVLGACGEPARKATRMEGYTQLHVWTFDLPGQPGLWVIELENGKVRSMGAESR